MSGNDSSEEHKGNAERDSADFQFAQKHADGNHHRKEDGYMCHGFRVGEQINEPFHIVIAS